MKRYVFWRTPQGKPYSGSDGKHVPTNLLSELGRSSGVSAEGHVTWRDFGLIRLESALRSVILVVDPDGEELNDSDSWSVFRSAMTFVVRKYGGGKPLCPAEVIRCADAHAADHFRTKKSDYVLVTSLSIGSLPIQRLRVKDCEIFRIQRRGTRYPLPECLKYPEERFERHLRSTKYRLIGVKVGARTIHEAAARAVAALDYVRGIWNFFATYRAWSMRFGGTALEPLGVVHRGPIHTLHRPDGSSTEDVFWYEPDFAADRKLFRPSDGWDRLETNRRQAMAKIARLPYRKELEPIIVRYAVALDHTDLNVAFLQLWSILEKLTDTVGANYDETVERTTWGWPDRNLAKEVLNSLRIRRNQYVHSADMGESHDQATFLMKGFVEPHLLRLMRNEFSVSTLEEYGRHLALPSNAETLRSRKRRIDHALRILRRWDEEK